MPATAPRAATCALLAALVHPLAAQSTAQSAAPAGTPPAGRPSFAEPSLSPDGREIAFVSGGDIWTVPAGGGEARLLVAHPATESRPLYSPDGRRLAFVSTRTGNGDVYVLDLATGALKRMTFDDAAESLDAWSADGRWLYFSSSAQDVAGMSDVYRVRVDGGTPMAVAADRYASEYWGAPAPTGSPDDALLAITARGLVSAQWWRNGHSHIDESEIWLVRPNASGAPSYTPVTTGGAKSAWPMWAPDGRTLYFMSDRSGSENLWAQPVADGRPSGAARQVTTLTAGRLLWPGIAPDGRSAVFERDFGIWRADLTTGQAAPVAITLRGVPAGTGAERATVTSFQELAVSPDGRKLAVTARGEVFAAIARDATAVAGAAGPSAGGDAVRVTTTPGPEMGLAWSPDSRRVAYAAERDGRWQVAAYDFVRRRETVLTSGGSGPNGRGDVDPRWSPDGRSLAFVRDGRELRVIDVDTAGAPTGGVGGRERLLATALFDRPPFDAPGDVAWSRDGRWIAYVAPEGARGFSNVRVVPAAGGESRAVSFVANAFGGAVSWSPDGTALYFVSGQRTEGGQALRIDLVPRPPRFREDQFRELFAPPGTPPSPTTTPARDSAARTRPGPSRVDSALAVPPGAPAPTAVPNGTPSAGAGAAAGMSDSAARRATRPVRIDFADIRQRLSVIPAGVDVQGLDVSPDGRQLLLVAAAAGQQNLWTWSLDELARETPTVRQLTSTSGSKSDAHWSPDGREVFYREGGRLLAVTVDTRAVRPIPVVADLDVDFDAEKGVVFRQAWTTLRDHFYDPEFHGVDWNAVRTRVAPQAAGARTPDELRRVLNLMIGELNASHSGAGGAPPQPTPVTGRLGVRFDRAAAERDGTLRVREVLPLGPAALAGIRPGDALVAIDGRPLGATDDLDDRLAYTVGRRVALTVAGAGGARREVAVRPVALGAEKRLLYRAWVESRRTYVDSVSNHRLGYVHLPDMSAESLTQLYADLDAENQAREGVVVDIRNNNGGFVNAYALDVFTRRPYLSMQRRDQPQVSARSALGQRALERPTVLVTNQHSLSDAEDFSEGYHTLGLGRIVGEPTAGWIIYTSGTTLVDGTSLRVPFIRIRGADGRDMERHPRPVDVPVTRPVGESYTGRDSQLDAAVRVLLGR